MEQEKKSGGPGSAGLKTTQAILWAVVAGFAVGNLYWAQPLLAVVAQTFGLSTGSAGILITVTQIGYALGIVVIVPVGDMVNRRRLIPLVMGLSVLALAGCFLAPNMAGLMAALGLLGMTTVSGQLIVPLASDRARADQRGRMVGTIVSGILTGILLSRTLSGFLADLWGWRSIYILAAAATLVLMLLTVWTVPPDRRRPHLPYFQLLASIPAVIRQHPSAGITLVIGATAFSVFTAFWTGLTFLLSSPPYSYSLGQIGLVGLVGVAGALAAQRAGWLHDHGFSVKGTGAGLLVLVLSLGAAAFGAHEIGWVLAAVLFLDIAVQTINVLNQTRLFSLAPEARSRINTAFVFCNFVGGAVGSALAGILWDWAGWMGIMGYCGTAGGLGLAVWVFQRNKLNPVHVEK